MACSRNIAPTSYTSRLYPSFRSTPRKKIKDDQPTFWLEATWRHPPQSEVPSPASPLGSRTKDLSGTPPQVADVARLSRPSPCEKVAHYPSSLSVAMLSCESSGHPLPKPEKKAFPGEEFGLCLGGEKAFRYPRLCNAAACGSRYMKSQFLVPFPPTPALAQAQDA